MNGKLEKQLSRHLDPDTPLRPWGSTLGLASGPGVPAGVVPGSLAGLWCLSMLGARCAWLVVLHGALADLPDAPGYPHDFHYMVRSCEIICKTTPPWLSPPRRGEGDTGRASSSLCFSDMGLYCFCVVLYFTRTDSPGFTLLRLAFAVSLSHTSVRGCGPLLSPAVR